MCPNNRESFQNSCDYYKQVAFNLQTTGTSIYFVKSEL
jgi:hypothetical protein